MGNTAQHCRLGLFQDSDFAGALEDSKSISGGVLYFFGETEHLFQSVGCAGNKHQFLIAPQESELISLDAGLRMDGLPALGPCMGHCDRGAKYNQGKHSTWSHSLRETWADP